MALRIYYTEHRGKLMLETKVAKLPGGIEFGLNSVPFTSML